MKLLLNLLTLSANLPLEDSQISFFLSDKNTPNNFSDDLNSNLNGQHVLMSDITEMTLTDTRFVIEVENPEEPKKYHLFVLATSISTSKVVLLGQVPIDTRKLLLHQIQNGTKQTIKEPLLEVNNQKGNLTFEIQTIQPQIYSSHRNLKSSESLDREQTCSSDSYEANLKDLNKTSSSDETEDFSPRFKQSLENHYRNVDYTQKIILEEIDLEDDEDDEVEQAKMSKKQKNQSNGVRKPKDSLRYRLMEERLKIQIDLHNLQESDFFLMRMEQKLKVFAE